MRGGVVFPLVTTATLAARRGVTIQGGSQYSGTLLRWKYHV